MFVFINPVPYPFLTYDGSFNIQRAYAYEKDGKKIPCVIDVIDDRNEKSPQEWNYSESKYENINKIKEKTSTGKTNITYTMNDNKVTINNKNKKIRKPNSGSK